MKNWASYKRKRKYHTLVSSASEFHSPSLPTSSCHPSEASATRSHTTDSFPSSCQSFRRISVTAFLDTRCYIFLHVPPFHHRSNNTAALFKLCCTQLSHLQAFKWEVSQVSIVSNYTSTHSVNSLQLRKKRFIWWGSRTLEGGRNVCVC